MTTGSSNYESIMSGAREHGDILVLGKTGNGKSAVCNTLLGRERFTLGRSMTTTTTTVQYDDLTHDNMTIRVIDTPDITNNGLGASEREREVGRWKTLLPSLQPSMTLLVVRSDVRFTSEEMDVYREILSFWRSGSLEKTLVVAFTFSDRMDDDIRDVIRQPPPELAEILRRAKNRYLMFTNKDDADRPSQARRCFAMMGNLQHGGSDACPFTCCTVL